VLATQGQPPRAAHAVQQAGIGVHVHRVGLVAGQAQQHGLVAAVALAGGAERAVQLACTRATRGSTVVRQPLHEQPRRAHRPHGVAAARADADLEEVEDGDGHGGPFRR
jgi:hypothetical protein